MAVNEGGVAVLSEHGGPTSKPMAIHKPYLDLAGRTIVPQDIGYPVLIEVVGSHDAPWRSMKVWLPSSPSTVARLVSLWLSINQIWISPVELLCHKILLITILLAPEALRVRAAHIVRVASVCINGKNPDHLISGSAQCGLDHNPARRCGSGRRSLARGSRTRSGGACRGPTTSGTSTRSPSRSPGRRTGCGAPSTSTVSCSSDCKSRQAVASQAPEAAGVSAALPSPPRSRHHQYRAARTRAFDVWAAVTGAAALPPLQSPHPDVLSPATTKLRVPRGLRLLARFVDS